MPQLLSRLRASLHPSLPPPQIPSDSSDGRLDATGSDYVIDLAQAVTGQWDSPSSKPGSGIYDPVKWAVVFKYDFVHIPDGTTVRFLNHPSHAPVVWLVGGSGYVNIEGTLILDGADGIDFNAESDFLTQGGPGGFRGGLQSSGFGPGGTLDGDGQYSGTGPLSYGKTEIVPLIGGSGAGAGSSTRLGGGGGGAILIAASGGITVSGTGRISANGGSGHSFGSGGAIRLVADKISGLGRLSAIGGSGGRIRLEANSLVINFLTSDPPLARSFSPGPIWPSANATVVRVVSIGGVPAPADPRAPLEEVPADVLIASDSVVTIVVETANFPITGRVNVLVKPRNGTPNSYPATLVSGTDDLATWQVQQLIPPVEYCTIQARAVAP